MRHVPTPAEDMLWQQLRNRHLHGAKFRRQYAIERFVDFACLEYRLVIEVDGSIHEQQQEIDAIRQEFLEALGFRVLRFTIAEVLHRLTMCSMPFGKPLPSLSVNLAPLGADAPRRSLSAVAEGASRAKRRWG